MTDDYQRRSYGEISVGTGEKPGIVVVDFQLGFTDPQYPLGGAPLVMRAVENTAKLLKVARRVGVPVAVCNTAYMNEREMPYWKITAVKQTFLHDHPEHGARSAHLRARLRSQGDQEGPVDLLRDRGRQLLHEGAGRHDDRDRLQHLGLHPRQRARLLQPPLPHPGARGLRRRHRGTPAPATICATSAGAMSTSPTSPSASTTWSDGASATAPELAALANVHPFRLDQFGHAHGLMRSALRVEPAAGTTSSKALSETSQ